MKIQLPEHVKQIIHRLQQEGYDAYAVGGCVREDRKSTRLNSSHAT